MAARLWYCLFGCGFALAAALGAILWILFPVSAEAALAVALGIALCLPAALVGASFLAAAVLSGTRPTLSDVGYRLRALLTEIVDFNISVLAMMAASPLKSESPGNATTAGDRPLLLIHGVICNHGIWQPWLASLRAAGFGPVRVMDLEPPFADIEAHAARVERELRVLKDASGGHKVDIVAHSMGGLVARAALRRVGPDVIGHIVTIASPHHGTRLARLFRWPPLQQMRADSVWLGALNSARPERPQVPLTSIYSLEDNLVVPARSAVLEGARVLELRGIGHVGMLSSRKVIESTLTALRDG